MVNDWALTETIGDYALYAEHLAELGTKPANAGLLHILLNGPLSEYDFEDDDRLKLADIFSPEAKFSYFLRFRDEGEPLENWRQSPLFAKGKSAWSSAQQLLESMGLKEDSPLTLREFQRVGFEKVGQRIIPALHEVILKDPQTAIKQLVWYFEGNDAKLKQIQSMLRSYEMPRLADDPCEQLDIDRLFAEAEEKKRLKRTPRSVSVFALPSSLAGQCRYAVAAKDGGDYDVRSDLLSLIPPLKAEVQLWQPGIIAVPEHSASHCALEELAHPHKQLPGTQIKATHCFGTALQCAATSREVNR